MYQSFRFHDKKFFFRKYFFPYFSFTSGYARAFVHIWTDIYLLEVSEGPSFSKLNLSVIYLSFLSVWNNVMVSDFKILGRKIRKGIGKWNKKRKKWKRSP